MQLRFRQAILCIVGICSLSACGKSGEFPVAKVEGIVKCNGRPLTAGLVVFVPEGTSEAKGDESGRSASGVIQSDGTYELTTYANGDGAIVGTHSVKVFAPAPVDDDAPLTDANRYACGNAPLEKTVEQVENVIDLELTTSK